MPATDWLEDLYSDSDEPGSYYNTPPGLSGIYVVHSRSERGSRLKHLHHRFQAEQRPGKFSDARLVIDAVERDFEHTSSSSLESIFHRERDLWEMETAHLASIVARCVHPAYQRIIGLGEPAVPLLLRALRDEPDQWFWALSAITRVDPGVGEETFDGAAAAWLAWGRKRGLIT